MAVAATAVSLQRPDWLEFLRAACAVAEGAAVLDVGSAAKTHPSRSAADAAACLSAVLGDPLRRIAVMGGREGMPRSLGSVYGGSVTRFLGGFRGVLKLTIATPGVITACGLAMSRDGTTLLVADALGGSHALHVYSAHTGAFLRRIGGYGDGPLQFNVPFQVCVAPDGFVVVADRNNARVQVLTPQLTFHSLVGEDQLDYPVGVCANNDVIVVSELLGYCLTFFSRRDGTLLRRVGSFGGGDTQLRYPRGLCLISGHRQVAVADSHNRRISVWTLEGEFVRHISVGELYEPTSIACSDANELVVSEWLCGHDSQRFDVKIFSASGDLMQLQLLDGNFHSVAMHSGTCFAQALEGDRCVVCS